MPTYAFHETMCEVREKLEALKYKLCIQILKEHKLHIRDNSEPVSMIAFQKIPKIVVELTSIDVRVGDDFRLVCVVIESGIT